MSLQSSFFKKSFHLPKKILQTKGYKSCKPVHIVLRLVWRYLGLRSGDFWFVPFLLSLLSQSSSTENQSMAGSLPEKEIASGEVRSSSIQQESCAGWIRKGERFNFYLVLLLWRYSKYFQNKESRTEEKILHSTWRHRFFLDPECDGVRSGP